MARVDVGDPRFTVGSIEFELVRGVTSGARD
jgi:hypothetical protein